jgi:hypothetical protein
MAQGLEFAVVAVRVALVLAMNGVVIAGFFGEGWTPGTVLALYWLQTVLSIPLTALLIVLHKRATRKLGHSGSFLSTFLSTSIVFAIAHGIFLAFILGFLLKRSGGGAIDLEDVRLGASLLGMMMLAGFLVELPQLKIRPFAWIRHRADTVLRRVILTHLVIIFGMFAAALSKSESTAFFGVFVAFKLLADIVGELPAWDPKEPPGWLVWIARRSRGDNKDPIEEWHRLTEEQRKYQAEAERTLDEVNAERAP